MAKRPQIATDKLLELVHERLGGLGVNIQTFGGDHSVEVTWKRDYDGVWSDERFSKADSLVEALWLVLDYENKADLTDALDEDRDNVRFIRRDDWDGWDVVNADGVAVSHHETDIQAVLWTRSQLRQSGGGLLVVEGFHPRTEMVAGSQSQSLV